MEGSRNGVKPSKQPLEEWGFPSKIKWGELIKALLGISGLILAQDMDKPPQQIGILDRERSIMPGVAYDYNKNG